MGSEASVELVLTPDTRWTLDVDDLVSITAAAGFSGLGLTGAQIDADTAATFEAAGIRCHEVMALFITDDDETTLKWAERLAHSAALVGAPWITTVFVAELDERRLELVARCAAMFADAGAGMAVEFTPTGSVSSISEGLAIVDAGGAPPPAVRGGRAGGAGAPPPRARLLVDTWHFHVGPSTWEDLEKLQPELLAYVQFSDVQAPSSPDGMDETMECRVMPGDGLVDLERFATTLRERGFDGLVSVEVLNRELRQLPVAEFAKRAYDSTVGYWS
jgi:sugar phosphate isomerase/epimerase